MIVQSAPTGRPRRVVHQLEHARLAGAFAQLWGNEDFAPLEPRDAMCFVARHHDEGWDEVDRAIGRDPDTGLPYSLVRTPMPRLLATSALSPDFNEAHHPWCGLLASMHTYGLYCGRYGLSDTIVVDKLPDAHRPTADAMLDGELRRQERLREQLAADPEWAPHVDQDALFDNYKRLQLFDMLSLYFAMTHDEARQPTSFPHVPRQPGDDVTVEVRRERPGVYALQPFPFAEDGVSLQLMGREMQPQPEGTNMAAVLADLPETPETFTLVAA